MSYPNDPFDPFDNGKQWQNIQSSSAWSNTAGASSNVVDTASGNPPATTTATLSSASASDSMQTGHFNYSSSSSAIPSIPPAPTAVLVQPTAPNLEGLSSSSTSAAGVGTKLAAGPTAMISEDMPPPYEATVIQVRQIHDNYDHLRGPPGQRGTDIKTRIPLDSTPSSHYTGGEGASGSGSRTGISSRSMPPPSSSSSGISPSQGQSYGAIPQVGHPSLASSVPQQHQVNTLHGQASHGRDDDELHSRDVDRLLGTQPDVLRPRAEGHDYDEEPDTHWGIVGNGKAWMGYVYLLFVLFPWALFCFLWTLVTAIVATVSMIVPPIGYFLMVAAITSWRALARVDLILSRSLVPWSVRDKYLHKTAKVFVPFSVAATTPAWNARPVPGVGARVQQPRGVVPHRQRERRRRNLWSRGVHHLKATVGNKHTFNALFYFLIWKFLFALAAFVLVLVLSVFAVPFMICLLPTLLIVCRRLVNWQFRWAVFWLTEKVKPIALP